MRTEFIRRNVGLILAPGENRADLMFEDLDVTLRIHHTPWRDPEAMLAGTSRAAFAAIRKFLDGVDRDVAASGCEWEVHVPRVTLRVHPQLAELPWEGVVEWLLGVERAGWPIVRLTEVRARSTIRILTFPLRFAFVDAHERTAEVSSLFQYQPPAEVEKAFQSFSCKLWKLTRMRDERRWPTGEVVHFGRNPVWAEPAATSTGDRELPGTLGWLLRLADTWHTRLIAFECDPSDVAPIRQLASRIVGAGGPAVVVAEAGSFDFAAFYGGLVHDLPLDLALPSGGIRPTLYAGLGREEALRVSSVAVGILGLVDDLESAGGRPPDEITELRTSVGWHARDPEVSRRGQAALNEVHLILSDEVRDQWKTIDFRDHESGGFLPVAVAIDKAREVAELGARPLRRRPVTGDRFVNSRLGTVGEDGSFRSMDQREAGVSVGGIYQLAIQIGPRDAMVRVAGTTGLIEEEFHWGPGVEGRWAEIGVTGLDFAVLGDPVQEVWIPKEGASEVVTFAISPGRKGIVQVRFGLFVDEALLQSFRLAVASEPFPRPEPVSAQLAEALDLPEGEIGDNRYLARLEYSTVSTAESMLTSPGRSLSIFANHLEDRTVVTMKGKNLFTVATDTKVSELVSDVRAALDSVSTIGSEATRTARYAFGVGDNSNVGSEEQLTEALKTIASHGWALFASVADKTTEVEQELSGSSKEIRVGHLLLDKVIPWALIYDRKYDAGRREYKSLPVDHVACLAPLDANPPEDCGQHSLCPLHPDREAERKASGRTVFKDTVACPLHIWGFRHVIEIPPQHVPAGEEPAEAKDCITFQRPALFAVGVNEQLSLAVDHVAALTSLSTEEGIQARLDVDRTRDDVVDGLAVTSVALAYLYCHAIGGEVDGNKVLPHLVFPYPDGTVGQIFAHDLAGVSPWEHGPLVFLNGCHTAGFHPDALSPFVETLVRGRGASAVVGTEISVWEQLATEMALRFLRGFLKGRPAGVALRTARFELLAEKKNPLGLAYTLFGLADLALDIAGDGECGKGRMLTGSRPEPQP